jgi:hypothetical protein
MPLFKPSETLQQPIRGTRYGFSGTRIEDLRAAEYTLVSIAADCSGSVQAFAPEIERCITEVVASCHRSARADNLMLRLVTFDDQLTEVHGFRPLVACDTAGYRGCIRSGNTTALFDATLNAVEAAVGYGQRLSDNDFDVNAIVFVITDGADNASSATPAAVADAIAGAIRGRAVESITTVLVGVGTSGDALGPYLEAFRRDTGCTAYIDLPRADATSLGKLARFVSRSIAVRSQALGSGHAGRMVGF